MFLVENPHVIKRVPLDILKMNVIIFTLIFVKQIPQIRMQKHTNWVKAMDNEIYCLDKNDTWILVNRDKNKHVLDVKWVYTI